MSVTKPRSARAQPLAFVITCEHGGNRIPRAYRAWFADAQEALATHLGYDPGSLAMARTLAAALHAPLIAATVSRLLVELNRSPSHPRVFSPMMRRAPAEVRQAVFERYYVVYRARVEGMVSAAIARGARVVHISSHSFTPVLDGVVRNADVGLLYDPKRPLEAALCRLWARALAAQAEAAKATAFTIRRNYPYAGRNDGLTTWLRRRYPDSAYAGIELEINHKHAFAPPAQWARMRRLVCAGLRAALAARLPQRT